jgi:hypothetical protein
MLTPFERGFVANLIADWLLQNDWMAKNKVSLRHPAAWTHAAIHAVALALALGWQAGLFLALIHMFVDTRRPAIWWRGVIKQTTEGPIALILKVVVDQVLHLVPIAIWVEIAARLGWLG